MKERNPEKSKAAILNAAEDEFANKGFWGARVDEIAASADINKRMIYAYFGDKEALYNAVLLNTYSKMEEVESTLIKRNLSGIELVKEIISTYFDFLYNNPNFVNILMWENLNKGKYLKKIENQVNNGGQVNQINDGIVVVTTPENTNTPPVENTQPSNTTPSSHVDATNVTPDKSKRIDTSNYVEEPSDAPSNNTINHDD